MTAAITLVWDSDSFSETRFPSVSAVLGPAGELTFESSGVADDDTVVTRWSLRPVGRRQIAGSFTVRLTDPRRSGYLEWESAIKPSAVREGSP